MRAPFPVEYTSASGGAWRVAVSMLLSASIAVPLAWGAPYLAASRAGLPTDPFSSLLAQPGAQALLAGGLAAMGFVVAWLWHGASSASERTLRWDGQDWVLPCLAGGAELRGRASLMLDLGPWMLARFRPYGGSAFDRQAWLPLAQGGDPAGWAALRAALWSCPRDAGRRPQ
jgi:hypothetical protein